MGPLFSLERMTLNSFAVCFASWAPLALKSGRFIGALGGRVWGRFAPFSNSKYCFYPAPSLTAPVPLDPVPL